MTKEEIREKHLFKNGLSVNNTPIGKKVQKAAYDAMEEYAKQEAVGFAEWIRDDQYVQSKRNLDKWYQMPYTEESDFFTTTELYELYLKSKQ